jgi:hypothetical protein
VKEQKGCCPGVPRNIGQEELQLKTHRHLYFEFVQACHHQQKRWLDALKRFLLLQRLLTL